MSIVHCSESEEEDFQSVENSPIRVNSSNNELDLTIVPNPSYDLTHVPNIREIQHSE